MVYNREEMRELRASMAEKPEAESLSINIPVESLVVKNSQSDSSIPEQPRDTNLLVPASNNSTPQIKSQSDPDGSPRPKIDAFVKEKCESASEADKKSKKKGRKWETFMFLIVFESIAFACFMVLLISSLTLHKFHLSLFWNLSLWQWCLLMLTVLSGRLIAHLCTKIMMFLIWRFWVHEKVLYFAFGVRKSVMFFIWVGLVTLAWGFMAENDVFRGIAGCLIGAFLWLVKTLLVRLVGCIHATKLLDKIKEAIGTRKLLVALSKTEETTDDDDEVGAHYEHPNNVGEFTDTMANKLFDEFISSENSEKEKICRDTMRELMNAIRGKRLLSLPHGDEQNENGDEKKPDKAAREAAADIFRNLKPDSDRCISLENLLPYVKDKKVSDQLKGLAETKTDDQKIQASVFCDWLVEVYREHDSLNNTLKHSKTAMDELNLMASVVALIINLVMWLLFMEFLTTKLLVFVSSQLLLVAFIFGNTVKTVFEAVVFVFLVHPFDVGDRCVVGGEQMIVDEMNILTTTFLRYDNEKIYYPNAVLASKPISNLYRSPPMSEGVEFAISLHTPKKTIQDLQQRIRKYLEDNPKSWHPDHSLLFKEIEDVNKMKVALFVNHTVNFHYVGKRLKRRSDLVLELKNIMEELKIEYRLLPQQVDITSVKWSPPAA